MKEPLVFPNRHENLILEAISEKFFRNNVPTEWIIEKPVDFGIDLHISPVFSGNVIGLNFSVQLKAQKDTKGKLETRLKRSTLNYLFNRLEPVMIILFDEKTNQAYWKWLLLGDFNLSKEGSTFLIRFDKNQNLSNINWTEVCGVIQKIFKVKNQLLTSLEYDLFNTVSDLEVKAWSHYFTKNHSEASFYFKRLVQQESKSIWLLALAQCEYHMFDYRNAIIHINKALELDNNENILLTKGCILAEDGIKNNDYRKLNEAEKIFNELYIKTPTAVHAYNYANTISKINKLEEAESLYKYALKLNPNYAEAWKNLGQIYYDMKKHKQEIKCYDNALRINPDLMQAKVSKAVTKGFIYNEYKNSIETLLESISKDEFIFIEFPIIFYWLSYFNNEINNIEEALKWTTKGLNYNPGDAILINLKAHILFDNINRGKDFVNEAISFFGENYQLNPNDTGNFYFLCLSIEKKGEKAKAQEMAINWLKKRPFLQAFSHDSDISLSFEEVMLIIKHLDVIESHAVHNSIEKVKLNLNYAEIHDNAILVKQVEIKRILFIAYFDQLLDEFSKSENLKSKITDIYKNTFLKMDEETICALITTSKEDTHQFVSQLSLVLVHLSNLCLLECTRCTGFVVGKRGLEKEVLLQNTVDTSLYIDTLLFYTEILYRHFELPME